MKIKPIDHCPRSWRRAHARKVRRDTRLNDRASEQAKTQREAETNERSN